MVTQDGFKYSISREMLTGNLDGTRFEIRAASGGRRGRAYDKASLAGIRSWDPGMKLPAIKASVGLNGINTKSDTKVVQILLNLYGNSLIPDGLVGPKTIMAIKAFQKSMGLSMVDGRVDPKGRTFQKGLLRDVAGGPLPPGTYEMQHQESHGTFGECIYLRPVQIQELILGITEYKKRSGFFIHGRGDRGSDGCIVPYIPSQRTQLNHALKQHGAHVSLQVVDPWMPPHLLNRTIQQARTC